MKQCSCMHKLKLTTKVVSSPTTKQDTPPFDHQTQVTHTHQHPFNLLQTGFTLVLSLHLL